MVRLNLSTTANMAAVAAGRPSKRRSKRIATACAFLSNISLDGNIAKGAAERRKEKASPKEINEQDPRNTDLPEATRGTRNKLLHSVSEPWTSSGESLENSSKRSLHRQRSITEAIYEGKCQESSVMIRRSVSMSESSYDPPTTSVRFQRTKNRISCLAGSSFHSKRRANDKRIVLCTSHKAPLATYSVLKYHKENQEAGQEGMSVKKISVATPSQSAGIEGVELGTIDKPVSYRSFLISTYPFAWNEVVANKGSSSVPLQMDAGGLVSENVEGVLPSPSRYDPHLLDDPELKSGRHKKVLNLTSYLVSMVAYAKPSELKKDLNEQFREKFPNLNITLTKLRSLKRDIVKIALSQDCQLDPTTVGYAFVYFEKLILKEKITKANRKLLAGSCLLLAAKFNGDMKREKIKEVIEAIEDRLRISVKELIRFEFQVVVALEFDLHIPQWEILPHVKRMETE